MGAVQRYPYPKSVWAFSGGWWNDFPKGYAAFRNKFVVGLVGVLAGTFYISTRLEREATQHHPEAGSTFTHKLRKNA
ncbi:hypothetical protein DFA_02252 [Cavenderia fasciculata]|uniref:Uncharacterized protein n=1 Tax=Cavenderia fasciculata TaxID=261658 RepID=F4PYY0_CACFS|nr:uncharacterized protein DFA_02252 [Cavenderia fasciculata]EGG19009.1 hypothetical protein DFA_02252 [Cavenderia fasciculata]|eukprot:XP_004366642.1 hypothetical protein DFA_02252 [Cavenderia fasciculata]